jgi:hypothetical protein|tara:strand:- start:4405 stop:4854 length:450 start_codon:yes stop_codon:yes gene_type:complete
MILSEQEKNRIRGLHRAGSVIKESPMMYKGPGYTGKQKEEGYKEDVIGVYSDFDDQKMKTNIHDDMDEGMHEMEEGMHEMEEGMHEDMHEDSEGEETYNYGEDEGEDRKREMSMEDRIDAIKDHLDHLKKDMGYDEDHEDRDEKGTDFE